MSKQKHHPTSMFVAWLILILYLFSNQGSREYIVLINSKQPTMREDISKRRSRYILLHNDPSSPFHIIRGPSISYSTDTEEDKDSIHPIGNFVSALYYLRSLPEYRKCQF